MQPRWSNEHWACLAGLLIAPPEVASVQCSGLLDILLGLIKGCTLENVSKGSWIEVGCFATVIQHGPKRSKTRPAPVYQQISPDLRGKWRCSMLCVLTDCELKCAASDEARFCKESISILNWVFASRLIERIECTQWLLFNYHWRQRLALHLMLFNQRLFQRCFSTKKRSVVGLANCLCPINIECRRQFSTSCF